jgi:hypothetical protein
MAQRVITYVEFTDDLTGETFAEGDGETLVYAFDGATYEIDLTDANAKSFREAMSAYVEKSRKTVDTRGRKLTAGGGKGTHPERPKKRRRTKDEMVRIRAWAKENGYPTGENTTTPNRVPFDTVQAYARLVELA